MPDREKVIKGLAYCDSGCGYDCPYWSDFDVLNCVRIMRKEALALLREQDHGWISVKDRTPDEKGWYMVYAPGYSGGSSSGLASHNGIMFSKWSGKTWSIETGYHQRPGCVKYWMPLPEPPEEV